jgi:ribonucleoside-diphosphate reductase alpha chain
VAAQDVAAEDHLLMQAALQPFVDGAIAKTITLGAEFPKSRVSALLTSAYNRSVKGCTLYRAAARPAVIASKPAVLQADAGSRGRYCDVDQECD